MMRKEIKSLKNSSDVGNLTVKKEELLKDYFNYRLQKAGNQLKQVRYSLAKFKFASKVGVIQTLILMELSAELQICVTA